MTTSDSAYMTIETVDKIIQDLNIKSVAVSVGRSSAKTLVGDKDVLYSSGFHRKEYSGF